MQEELTCYLKSELDVGKTWLCTCLWKRPADCGSVMFMPATFLPLNTLHLWHFNQCYADDRSEQTGVLDRGSNCTGCSSREQQGASSHALSRQLTARWRRTDNRVPGTVWTRIQLSVDRGGTGNVLFTVLWKRYLPTSRCFSFFFIGIKCFRLS